MGYIDKNGITFNSFDSNASAFKKKLSNTQYAGASVDDLADIANDNGGVLPTTINAVEIDWNGAQVAGKTLNTTGEMLSILQTAYNVAKNAGTVKKVNNVAPDVNGNVTITVGSTLSAATSTTLGGIKTGYTNSGKNYAVSLDTNSKAFVNVPWTDTTITVSDLGTTGNVLFLTGTTTRNNGGAKLTNLNTYNIGITKTGNLVKFDNGSNTSYKSFIHTINNVSSINGDGTITITQVTNATNAAKATTADKAITADTAKSAETAATANTATTASKVANTLTVQFNGTSTATFNGSAASTINITPAAIGAAAKSHKTTDGSNGIADNDEYGHVKLETFVTTVEDGVNVSKDYSSYTGYALSLIGAEILFNKLNENIITSEEYLSDLANSKIKTVFDIYLGDEHTSFSNSFICNHRTIGLSQSDVLNAIQNNKMFEIPCYITSGYSHSGNVTIASDFDKYTVNGSITFSNNTIKIPMGVAWGTIVTNYSNLPPLQVTIPTTQNTVAVTSITLDKYTLSFTEIGTNKTLIATVNPSNATNKTVTWDSSNKSVATVSTSGVVTPKANGNTNITATCGGKTATCVVSVSIAATSFSVSPTSGTITGPNGSVILKATRVPSNADGTVSWASKNGAVYFPNGTSGNTVTIKGAATPSTATDVVTARLGDWSASCNITVNQGTITGLTIGASVTSGNTISASGQTIDMYINNVTANMWGEGGANVGDDDFTFDWKITTGEGATLSSAANPVNAASVTPNETTSEPTSTDTPTPSSSPEVVTKITGLSKGDSVQLVVPANTSTTSTKTYTVTVTAHCLGEERKATYTVIVAKKVVETTYYWYTGQTKPTSMTSNPTPDDTNFTNNKWHTLAKNATSIAKTITGGTSGNAWYIAVPTSFGFKPTASDLVTPNNTWLTDGTISVNNVEYTLWKPSGTSGRQAVYMAKI